MTILVTGGAGFIGSAFVRMCIAQTSFRVVNLDKLTYAGNLEMFPLSLAPLCAARNRDHFYSVWAIPIPGTHVLLFKICWQQFQSGSLFERFCEPKPD